MNLNKISDLTLAIIFEAQHGLHFGADPDATFSAITDKAHEVHNLIAEFIDKQSNVKQEEILECSACGETISSGEVSAEEFDCLNEHELCIDCLDTETQFDKACEDILDGLREGD